MPALPDNIVRLKAAIHGCTLCPRRCGVDRDEGRLGACRTGPLPAVASYGPHFGEESVLVARGGSGAIFFEGCNLDCVFCQNFDISHPAAGTGGSGLSPDDLADIALHLERSGCENINFVSPSHVAHAVAETVFLARRRGLSVPVVYNSGGYDAVQTVRDLRGLIDIYMPDVKWASPQAGRTYSGVDDYPAASRAGLAEMYAQVGPLQVDARGRAVRGVIVRHLVMPNDLALSRQVIDLVAATAPGCLLNVMGQYHPAYQSRRHAELMGRVELDEFHALRQYAAGKGLALSD